MDLATNQMGAAGREFLAVFRREPGRSQLILKLGLAGPLLLLAWAWAGPWLLSEAAVLATTGLLVLAYGVAMTVLTAMLVHSADRWQVESAVEARRLMSRGRRGGREEAETVSFHHIHFLLRLQEEVRASRRSGTAASIVVMKVTSPAAEPSSAVMEQVAFDMAHLAVSHARTLTTPSAIGAAEYAFILPGADSQAAKALVSALTNALGDYWCTFGIASYPEDDADAETLLDQAREQCHGSSVARAS